MKNRVWRTNSAQILRDMTSQQEHGTPTGFGLGSGVLNWVNNMYGSIVGEDDMGKKPTTGRGAYYGAGDPDGSGKGYG